MLRNLLEVEGYEIEVATDGEDCLRIYRSELERGNTFHLVIVDYRMPKKDGARAIQEIHDIRSDQKILMITAFSEENLTSVREKHIQILTKPFDSVSFLAKIREMIGSA